MIDIVNFEAFPYPLGGEIDCRWDYTGQITNEKVLLFKSSAEIADDIIREAARKILASEKDLKQYLKDNKITFFPEIETYKNEALDFSPVAGQKYFYTIILAGINDNLEFEYSAIHRASATATDFTTTINVAPAKKLVFEFIEKLTDVLPGSDKAKIDVYDRFPILNPDRETDFFTVLRASSETAARFWGNSLGDYVNRYRQGIIQMVTINVNWWSKGQPKRRDHMTDLMDGARMGMERYCKKRYKGGTVIDVRSEITGDQDIEIENYQLHSCGLLITFFIESSMEWEKQAPLVKKVYTELLYDSEGEQTSETKIEFNSQTQ